MSVPGAANGEFGEFSVAGMALWKQYDRWTYQYFDADVEAGALPAFSTLIDVWHTQKKGKVLPSWADFDFYDFTEWLGLISVFEISTDPFDWRVRLSGTIVDELYGRNITGCTMDDLYEAALVTGEAKTFYLFNIENKYIGHTKGPLNMKGRDYASVEFLELPCSDDGKTVTHTIEAALRY